MRFASLPLSRRSLLAALGAALLGGCGFALRQPPSMAFSTIHVAASPGSPMALDIRRGLAALGSLQVTADPALQQQAQVILELVSEQREKVVVGVNSAGQVREFQLRVRLKFRLRTPATKELIAETELLQQREISFNETAVLAKEAEEGLLYRDMQADIVQQLLRRIAAVKSL